MPHLATPYPIDNPAPYAHITGMHLDQIYQSLSPPTTEFSTMRYTFTGPKDGQTTVTTPNEETARRLAMIARWGREPDPVTLHAPDYKGVGLDLISIQGDAE